MSSRGIIEAERPQQCDLCGKIAELRPYGPNGECVCFQCGMKDEAAALAKFAGHVFGDTMSREDAQRLLDEHRRVDRPTTREGGGA